MEESKVLDALAALASETRLRIVRRLVSSGKPGLAAGALAQMVGASSSRLSFHIAALENAGLVTSERMSRNIIYRANYPVIGQVIGYLMHDCCAAHPEICACSEPARAEAG